MTAGNRKHPYKANPGYDTKAPRLNVVLRRFYIMCVLLVIAGFLLGMGIGKAVAAPSPIRQANCWQNGNYSDLVVIDSPIAEINVVFGQPDQHKTFFEFWCRPNGHNFTTEIMVANSPWEIQRLRMWFYKYDYKNTFLYCRSGDKAWTIADLEDYPKKRTLAQIAGYNSWATAYAARNDCKTKR